MKRAAAFFFLVFCCGALLGDSGSRLLEDLVRMTRAGSSDVAVLAYAKAHRLELQSEVSEEQLRWLRESGVAEPVVRYMSAIDVRASDGWAPPPGEPSAAYSSRRADNDDYGDDSGGYAETYSGAPDAYAGYDDGYYPYQPYGYGYDAFYGYPVYFFVDRRGFVHRFRGRDRFDRFPGRRGGAIGRGRSRDLWRDRGFGGRRGNAIAVRPRGPGRLSFPRGGFSAGFQGPSGRFGGTRGFATGHGSFSQRGGGGFSRGPRAGGGPPAGRGRR